MGGARNTVGALKQILTKKSYRGKLKYLHPPPPPPSELERNITTPPPSTTSSTPKQSNMLTLKNIKLNEQRYSAYHWNHNNLTTTLTTNTTTTEKIQCPLLEQYFYEDFKAIAPEYCTHTANATNKNITTTTTHTIDSTSTKTDTSTTLHSIHVDTNSSLMVTEIEDKFSLFVAANISHLSYDFIASPMAHHHDGYIDLVYVKDNISRGEFLNIFLAAEKGDHIFEKAVNISKVKAFKLSPMDTGSYVVVDGEAVDYSDILVEVHPSMCNLLTL